MGGYFDSGCLRSRYAGKRVLITGSTGFKGSWLCQILLALGARVTGLALEPPTDPSNFAIARMTEKIDQRTVDVRDLDGMRKVFSEVTPDIVFHLAAQPIVLESYREPRYTYETNVMGTVNVLECARACESVASLLNVTTDKVYLNLERDGYGYAEDDKLDGFDPYSNSKSCSELVTHSYWNSFFAKEATGEAAGRCQISTARAGNVIGGGDFAPNRIVPDCVRAAKSGNAMVIRNPNSWRPYQHVLEPLLVYLVIAAAQVEDDTKRGWYNVGPDDEDCVSTGALVEMFARNWAEGFHYEVQHVNGPHEANFLKLDNGKIKRKLGWHPTWGIEQAVEKTVEWARAWVDDGDEAATACMQRQIDEYLKEL